MRYSDIGFRDDNQSHREVGKNANIILFSEKLGHQQFLSEMADKFKCSIIALGGKPSVLNVEYFVDDMKAKGVNIRKRFNVYGITDFDPHGWIIRDSFIDDLKHYGIKHIKLMDMITPDMLTTDEIKIAQYRLPQEKPAQRKITHKWLKRIRKINMRWELMEEDRHGDKFERFYCGLESESVSATRLSEKLAVEILPLIRKK